MGAVTVEQMRQLEGRVMASGISEAQLMKTAGEALGHAIARQFPEEKMAVAFIGKGHNAGDALIALRVLRDEYGFKVGVRSAYPFSKLAKLTQTQWEAIGSDKFLEKGFQAKTPCRLLLIDGLLGIGGSGGLREPLLALAQEMENLRSFSGATVISVDLPSGVDADSGEIFPGSVRADHTFTIGSAKVGLLASTATNAVGAISLVPVEGLSSTEGPIEAIAPQSADYGKSSRDFVFHKGKAGRVGMIAGSEQYTGAALLSALGAVHAGAGLVTLYVRKSCSDSIRSRLPMEVMLKVLDEPENILDDRLDALIIGPGLGEMSDAYEESLVKLISNSTMPLVMDADGIGLISRRGLSLDNRYVLTPHPGEFARLAPSLQKKPREQACEDFVRGAKGAVLLLKGARTIVASEGRRLRINTTGTPAMSNGGQGDLLSGVIGALIGSGLSQFDAASLGAWACGHAAELVERDQGSPAVSGEVARYLGRALRAWKCGER